MAQGQAYCLKGARTSSATDSLKGPLKATLSAGQKVLARKNSDDSSGSSDSSSSNDSSDDDSPKLKLGSNEAEKTNA